ncbi:MAG: ribonuclease R [Opitutales bacterium]
MDIHNAIIELLGAEDYVPMRREEICEALELDAEAKKEALQLIEKMLQRGEIARLKKDRLCIPKDADLVSGRILFRQSGAASLIPDNEPGIPAAAGYPVAAEDTAVALHGDRVLARINATTRRPRGKAAAKKRPDPDAKPNVRVIRILERVRDTITGTLERSRYATYVIPDDPRIIQDILVPDPNNSGIRPVPEQGDKVVVKLVEWRQRHLNPEGEIIELLGKTHEPDAEFKAILHKYDLNPAFPSEVERQTDNVPDAVRAKDREGRIDCRDVFTFTIDPDDAKDFDDALSVEELKGGNVRVGIHIADVNAYVKPGSPLDVEAQKRANSTYLVGTVIPMLPHALSNGICSLVEGEERLTKAVFITYTAKAEIEKVEFANTLIRSNKRLTYRQAYAFLEEDDLDVIRKTPLPPKHQTGSIGRSLEEVDNKEMQLLQGHIRKLWKIAERLRKQRFRSGSLDLDMTEVKIYVDERGYADRIEKQENDESHQLIEEFMLSANEQVAREMKRMDFPCIYRVHDEPDEEKLQELRETMLSFGVPCGNLSKPREMGALLRKLKEHPQSYTLKVQVLRSLKQAQYRANPEGHYGLGKSDYTHFTSPIRRYADLIVHRVFDAYLHKTQRDSAPENPDIQYKQGKLESLGEHLSISERNSIDAERESIKTKLLEFYERELNREEKHNFKAVITDVKNHGLFVELTDTLAFGLVHISTLDDDFYHMNDEGTALIGRRRRKVYELGQHISVQVERVDRFKRQIDFRICFPEGEGKQAARRSNQQRRGAKGKQKDKSDASSARRGQSGSTRRGGKSAGAKKSAAAEKSAGKAETKQSSAPPAKGEGRSKSSRRRRRK